MHHYTSTYCMHKVHDRCRLACKVCTAPCECDCHKETPVTKPFARLLKAERIAQQFHETRARVRGVLDTGITVTEWKDLDVEDREFLIAVFADLLERGVLDEGKFW
jgi:hypothetical protein